MTHDELLTKIEEKGRHPLDTLRYNEQGQKDIPQVYAALRAVVELHKPLSDKMQFCMECKSQYNGESDVVAYPCPTIQAIEKELT